MSLVLTVAGALAVSPLKAGPGEPAAAQPDTRVLTSFEELWSLPEAVLTQRHHVRLEYTIYYYDSQWMVLWGRCGKTDSYLSLGPTHLPIHAGQKVLVDGLIQPKSLFIENPTVTVLAESAPIEVFSTEGHLGEGERFDKRMVTMRGYVDRQVWRDANHLELRAVSEGRLVVLQLLQNRDGPLPRFEGALIKAKGVYTIRREAGSPPSVELWVSQAENIEIAGSIDSDPRFEQPLLHPGAFAAAAAEDTVHVAGTVSALQPGTGLTLQDGAETVHVLTPQSLTVNPGDTVEVVGTPQRENGGWLLRDAIARPLQKVLTSVADLWRLSEEERAKLQQVRFDVVVYYYDPAWRILWCRSGDTTEYVSLGGKEFPLKAGQRVRIEGRVHPSAGVVVEDARVTILGDAGPLRPMATAGRIRDTEALGKSYVAVEGYVDHVATTDPNHLEVDMIVEGRSVIARVQVQPAASLPNWEGALVRVTGVYSATPDPAGGGATIEIWTQSSADVVVLGTLDADPRLKAPIQTIETFATLTPGTPVHLTASTRSQELGKSVTVRDATGQVRILTAQTRILKLGDPIEIVGTVDRDGADFVVRDAIFRPSKIALPPPGGGLARLRVADQIRELRPEEAARGYPVRLSGVVTWARANADFFFIRDSSGGICVYRPTGFTGQVYFGTTVEVTGVTAPGKYIPVVMASNVQAFARIELPEPAAVTLEQALTGIEEAQWVAMSGYVRGISADGPWARADLTTPAGEFSAMLPPNNAWDKLVGSVVTLRGVCVAVANNRRQLTGIRLWVAAPRFVSVDEPAPDDPFGAPLRSIASLRQFTSLQSLNRRVRVSGVVTRQVPGRLVNIQDGAEALLVLTGSAAPLQPGDRIEAVGFPGREDSRVVLRESIVRKLASGPEPVPQRLANLAPMNPELGGRLVQLEGTVLDAGPQEAGTRLLVQGGRMVFEALLPIAPTESPVRLVPLSRVALTGVYDLQLDEDRRPSSVRLQLRRASDVRVMQQPPWWTARRAFAATAVLTIVVLLGFGWVLALRRRVELQRGVIRDQEESEKAARLEAALARASKLESLGVLAGGIAHDFNNLLTVVLGNVSLARMDLGLEQETQRCLNESEKAANRARDLTQQLLTFAKGGEPIRIATKVPDIVREAAQFALHGSKVRCEFDFALNLWPAHVDRGQTGQVVHNLIINAHQAMPHGGVVRVTLRNEDVQEARAGLEVGRYVRLAVADTGEGIAAENVGRIFEPYFTTKRNGNGLGLATVYSIVKKHQGHIDVVSAQGEGTTFTIWLPASADDPEVTIPPAPHLEETTARVLFMDDEEAIQKLGGAVLRRLGFDVTVVAHGDAVLIEYGRALREGRPFDLVILDLTVPGALGGAEAMEQLREMDPQICAIVSSGYSSDPVMANFDTYGFRARVPKPYRASELGETVRAVLQGRARAGGESPREGAATP